MKRENAIRIAPQRGLSERRKDEKTVAIMPISYFEERMSSENSAYGAGGGKTEQWKLMQSEQKGKSLGYRRPGSGPNAEPALLRQAEDPL